MVATRTYRRSVAGAVVAGAMFWLPSWSVAAALVGANDRGCFSRSYSEEHLAAHQRQRTIEAAMHLAGDNVVGPEAENMALRLTLRRPPEVAEQFGHCIPNGDAFQCYIEGDAGEIVIHRLADGRLRLTIKRLSYESATRAADLETSKGADDTLTLSPDGADACSGLDLPTPGGSGG